MTEPSMRLLVVGGSGYLGRWCVKICLDYDIYKVRVMTRHPNQTRKLFKELKLDITKIEIVTGDVMDSEDVDKAMENVDFVIVAYNAVEYYAHLKFDCRPSQKDEYVGNLNLITSMQKNGVKHTVFVSSACVSRLESLPTWVLNMSTQGTLKYRLMTESRYRDSGIPYTIVRPGFLADRDLIKSGKLKNSELFARHYEYKKSMADRQYIDGMGFRVKQGDKNKNSFASVTSDIAAEACLSALFSHSLSAGKTFELYSGSGEVTIRTFPEYFQGAYYMLQPDTLVLDEWLRSEDKIRKRYWLYPAPFFLNPIKLIFGFVPLVIVTLCMMVFLNTRKVVAPREEDDKKAKLLKKRKSKADVLRGVGANDDYDIKDISKLTINTVS